jgi:uncharacterized repeat protein (TIGR03803 family)
MKAAIMRTKLPLSVLMLVSVLGIAAASQQVSARKEKSAGYKVLRAFTGGKDGGGLWGSVAFDRDGNLYGVTQGGGAYNGGTAFRLTPSSHGEWMEAVLHNFQSSAHDGAIPFGGPTLDAAGNVYGTTPLGGTHHYGTVYKLTRGSNGWREDILHNFCARRNCSDGADPWGSLVIDGAGNLYGTADSAFKLSRGTMGWTEVALHLFTGNNGDGLFPQAGPIRDAAGNLYGTTRYGGGGPWCAPDGCGIVWELSPPTGSAIQGWTEHILYRFGLSRTDGDTPSLGQLAMDPEGNLYGAAGGGKYKAGIVYRVTRTAGVLGDTWRTTILYNFTGGADGSFPGGGVILDSAGNLYGTTIAGGSSDCGCGVVFKLSPQTDGSWKYTLLHTFVGADGAQPDANLTLGPDGKLYGTAATGGAHGGGVVFQLTP